MASYSVSYSSSRIPLNLRREVPTAATFLSLCRRGLNFPLNALPKGSLRQRLRCYQAATSASIHVDQVVDDDRSVEEDNKIDKDKILRVGVICGGPSAERGISLNSARSVLDHIQVLAFLTLRQLATTISLFILFVFLFICLLIVAVNC